MWAENEKGGEIFCDKLLVFRQRKQILVINLFVMQALKFFF